MKIFIGHDPAAGDAYRVAYSSLTRRTATQLDVTPLSAERLAACGMLRRPVDARGGLYDLHSQAPCSTPFAISRFMVPMLAQAGWALFTDSDVVFLADVAELFFVADESKAVQVVKHTHEPAAVEKMAGRVQTAYPRKNWSSVMLWNCCHPANRRLTLDDVNHRPGRDLHAFYWLHDDEIGELPARWNWLVGEQPRPVNAAIAHFTRGGPWIDGWQPAEFDDLWTAEASR